MRRFALPLMFALSLAGACAIPASAGYIDTPECRRDLVANELALRATLRDLEAHKNGPMAGRCDSWRRHVGVMRRAGEIYGRCSTGRERGENVGQMQGSIADFLEIIARNCR